MSTDAPRWQVRRTSICGLWAWAATATDCRHGPAICRCLWFARHADAVAHADREARRP